MKANPTTPSVLWDVVEVTLNVRVHDPGLSFLEQSFHSFQSRQCSTSGSKPVRVIHKLSFEYRFDHHTDRRLDNPITNHRYPQRSLLSLSRLLDPSPSDRLGPVSPIAQLAVQ